MKRVKKNPLYKEGGVTAIEYALLVAVVFLAAVTVVPQMMTSDASDTTSHAGSIEKRLPF